MSKIAANIQKQISSGELKMKPKIYFVVGNFIAILGIMVTAILGTFFTNLMIHFIRTDRLLDLRAPMLFSRFPWEYLLGAIIMAAVGLVVIKRTDVGYKKNYGFLAVLFFTFVILTGLAIDKSGFNERAKKRPLMKRIYRDSKPFPEPRNPEHQIKGKFHDRKNERNFGPKQY